MERTVLMLNPDQKQKLHTLAKQRNVSMSEISRQALNFYMETSPDDLAELATLSSLIETLNESNQKAQKALDEAEKAITETLNSLRRHHDTPEE